MANLALYIVLALALVVVRSETENECTFAYTGEESAFTSTDQSLKNPSITMNVAVNWAGDEVKTFNVSSISLFSLERGIYTHIFIAYVLPHM